MVASVYLRSYLSKRDDLTGTNWSKIPVALIEMGFMTNKTEDKQMQILDDLKKYGTVTVDKDMCIVCVVGDLEWENVGFEAKALDAMRDIPVRMISFGGSNYNISFLIRECDKNKALQSLSDALFNEE